MENSQDDDRPVIACFPPYPPVELFHSMGLRPVVLWGLRSRVTSKSIVDRHVQAYACSVARHAVEWLLEREKNEIDAVFTYNACDTIRNLPEPVGRGARRTHGAAPLMARWHVPMTGFDDAPAKEFFEGEVDSLIGTIEDAFSTTFSMVRFKKSVETYRKARSLAQELEMEAAAGGVTFTKVAIAIHEGYFTPVEEHVRSLEIMVREIAGAEGEEGVGSRILLSGILPPPPPVTDAMAKARLRVVANDLASMHRTNHHAPGTFQGPGEYYIDYFSSHVPCPTLLYTADSRIAYLLELVKASGARGVVFVGEKYCEYEYLEMPFIESRLKKEGIKTLVLEFAEDDKENLATARNRVESFSELLGGENQS